VLLIHGNDALPHLPGNAIPTLQPRNLLLLKQKIIRVCCQRSAKEAHSMIAPIKNTLKGTRRLPRTRRLPTVFWGARNRAGGSMVRIPLGCCKFERDAPVENRRPSQFGAYSKAAQFQSGIFGLGSRGR
jgi:hypothetical protein